MGRTTMHMNVNSLAGTPMYMVSIFLFKRKAVIFNLS